MARLTPFVLLAALLLVLVLAQWHHATPLPALDPATQPAIASDQDTPDPLPDTPFFTPSATPILDFPDTPDALQARLHASNEEWAVIFPKLQRIDALRDTLDASADYLPATSRRRTFNGPMGGTSLDAPVVTPRTGNRGGRFGMRENPFSPDNAPSPSLLSTLANGIGRAITSLAQPNQPNSVQTLLAELQTLVDTPDSTTPELADKLASVRAARAKAARDLALAQEDLLPLLTTEQIATLVAFAYLD